MEIFWNLLLHTGNRISMFGFQGELLAIVGPVGSGKVREIVECSEDFMNSVWGLYACSWMVFFAELHLAESPEGTAPWVWQGPCEWHSGIHGPDTMGRLWDIAGKCPIWGKREPRAVPKGPSRLCPLQGKVPSAYPITTDLLKYSHCSQLSNWNVHATWNCWT